MLPVSGGALTRMRAPRDWSHRPHACTTPTAPSPTTSAATVARRVAPLEGTGERARPRGSFEPAPEARSVVARSVTAATPRRSFMTTSVACGRAAPRRRPPTPRRAPARARGRSSEAGSSGCPAALPTRRAAARRRARRPRSRRGRRRAGRGRCGARRCAGRSRSRSSRARAMRSCTSARPMKKTAKFAGFVAPDFEKSATSPIPMTIEPTATPDQNSGPYRLVCANGSSSGDRSSSVTSPPPTRPTSSAAPRDGSVRSAAPGTRDRCAAARRSARAPASCRGRGSVRR